MYADKSIGEIMNKTIKTHMYMWTLHDINWRIVDDAMNNDRIRHKNLGKIYLKREYSRIIL